MSAPNIINVLALLILIWFTFSVAGMNLFSSADFYTEYSENANFTSFYLSMLMMIRCSTGENWNVIMHEIAISQGIGAIIFFCIYIIITYFIMMNVFVAVIGQSFNEN
jgi:glucose-6-phosphate-specific signal transduction histidine kinase